MAETEQKILTSVADGVAWLILNNPERHNAISVEMWQAMTAALERFEADPTVRVLDRAWSWRQVVCGRCGHLAV